MEPPARPSVPLRIRTLAVRRELPSGDVVAHPLVDPARSVAGPPEEALLELRLFLEGHLAIAPPDELARHALPPGVELRAVTVTLPAELVRGSERRTVPLEVACAVVPAARGSWVLVLPLGHTLFVAPAERLEEVVEAEVVRLLAIDVPEDEALRDLCPPVALDLVSLELELAREEGIGDRATASLRRRLGRQERRRHAREVLRSVGDLLHERPEAREGPPLVARERETTELCALLGREARTSVLLVGPELAGKTAVLLEALRRERAAGRERFVCATSAARLVAGMSGLGQWQERIRRVVEACAELDAVLYFDALGDLLADRATSGTDLVSALRGPVEQGKLRLVGEMTAEALGLFEGRHAGFLGGMVRLLIEPLATSTSVEVVQRRQSWATVQRPGRPRLDAEGVRTLVELAARFLPYQSFPGKAVRLLEELQDEHAARAGGETPPPALGSREVAASFAARTGLPSFLVREDQPLRVADILAFFGRRVVGQELAVRRVAETLCVAKAGLAPPDKPLATFLFVGPTGVGKTEVARTLAAFLFGSAERLVRFDMSEHADPWAAERLVRGSGRSEGLLTRRIRQQPFSVLLLDEVEKAHPAVHDLLLQLCGEGRLTDGRGKTTWFHDTLVILTSNLGASHRAGRVGLHPARGEDEDARYLDAVARAFRPELVARLDRIVPFRALDGQDLRAVAAVVAARLGERRGAAEQRLVLDVTDEALDWLVARSTAGPYGARALRRTVEDELVAPAARLLATLPEASGVTLRADGAPGLPELRLSLVSRASASVRRGDSSAAISAHRREAGRLLRLERVQAVRAEVEFLVSQLAGGPARLERPIDGRGLGAELQRLRTDHHRLARALEAVDAALTELDAVEELAVVAALDLEDASPLLEDAEAARRRFRRALLEVLVCNRPVRDEITLAVSELDPGRGFSLWLAPLLEHAETERWSLVVHGRGVAPDRQEDWKDVHGWGPPRSAAWLLDQLEERNRPFGHLLLRVRGPYAGILLSLEAGLHRWTDVVEGREHVHLLITRMAMKADPTPEEWSRPAFELPPPPQHKHLPLLPAVRAFDGSTPSLSICGARRALSVAPGSYWPNHAEIALEHLLLYEREGSGMDPDELYAGRLELSPVVPEEP